MEKHIEILVDRTEYITKEEAYKVINEQYHETGLDGYQDGIELMNHIAKIPAADVVEVRHGTWLRTPTGWVYCSVCGEEPPEETNARTNYCPNCGAKMDGGKDND